MLSCNQKSQKEIDIENITKLEETIYSDSLKKIDIELANKLMLSYSLFSENHKDDKNSAEYLFKAGEIAMNLNMSKPAISYFNKVSNQYPTFEKAPTCIFLQAFIFENQLNDNEKAKKLYEAFIEKNPDHILTKDAKASLKNLGKSLEEIIKEFETKANNE
jgi:TolA-binding protein